MSLQQRKLNPDFSIKTEIKNQYSSTQRVATSVKLTPKNSAQEARTNQAFKKSTDINEILKRFRTTGVIDHVAKYEPEYGELTAIDFETAFNTVKKAKEMFAELPANIRAKFHNQPENFLQFMEEDSNRTAEAIMQASESRNPPESETTHKTKETVPKVSEQTAEKQ